VHGAGITEQKPLGECDPDVGEDGELPSAFHSLGNDLRLAGPGQIDDRAQDGIGGTVIGHLGEYPAIDLEDIEGEITQTRQDETPAPKSSIARVAPAARRSATTASVSPASTVHADSVSSMMKRLASKPCLLTPAAKRSPKPGVSSCGWEMLMLIRGVSPAPCQAAACRHTSLSPHSIMSSPTLL
jgi:hypothetical protein